MKASESVKIRQEKEWRHRRKNIIGVGSILIPVAIGLYAIFSHNAQVDNQAQVSALSINSENGEIFVNGALCNFKPDFRVESLSPQTPFDFYQNQDKNLSVLQVGKPIFSNVDSDFQKLEDKTVDLIAELFNDKKIPLTTAEIQDLKDYVRNSHITVALYGLQNKKGFPVVPPEIFDRSDKKDLIIKTLNSSKTSDLFNSQVTTISDSPDMILMPGTTGIVTHQQRDDGREDFLIAIDEKGTVLSVQDCFPGISAKDAVSGALINEIAGVAIRRLGEDYVMRGKAEQYAISSNLSTSVIVEAITSQAEIRSYEKILGVR